MKTALFLVVMTCVGCANVEIKKNIDDLEKTDAYIIPEYLKYVDADATKDADAKANRKKIVESRQHIIDALKKATE
ncbi:MAG: hypothetical protein U0236_21290 [Nitrospira sp.]